jgi:hypothetical protein
VSPETLCAATAPEDRFEKGVVEIERGQVRNRRSVEKCAGAKNARNIVRDR